MAEKTITFKIEKNIATIGEPSPKGWVKELNIVKWNDGEPKVDIRDWSPEHDKCGRGITLTETEAAALGKALAKEFKK